MSMAREQEEGPKESKTKKLKWNKNVIVNRILAWILFPKDNLSKVLTIVVQNVQ